MFAYQQYETDAERDIRHWEANYSRLSARHKALLHTQPAKFAAARRAAHQNHLFIKALLAAFDEDNDDGGECWPAPRRQLLTGGAARHGRSITRAPGQQLHAPCNVATIITVAAAQGPRQPPTWQRRQQLARTQRSVCSARRLVMWRR